MRAHPVCLLAPFLFLVQALSKHIGHLFSRDPLVIFEGRIEEVDDDEEVRNFVPHNQALVSASESPAQGNSGGNEVM